MADTYEAVVGLSHPDSADGCKAAKADDFAHVTSVRTEAGEEVPGFVVAESPWLVEQGKVRPKARSAKGLVVSGDVKAKLGGKP